MAKTNLSVSECTELRDLAVAMKEEKQSSSPDFISRQLQFIDSTLPSKNTDVVSGKMRTAVYIQLLINYSDDAIKFLTKTACSELEWFPTPKKCLEILAKYTPAITDKSRALQVSSFFMQQNFDAFRAKVIDKSVTQEEINQVPMRWRHMLECQMLLVFRDGKYFVRQK
jgi:hypothetical protein